MVYQERFLSRSVQHAVLRTALYGGRLHALRRWLWNNGYIKLRHRHQGVPQRRWRWIPDQPQLRTVSAPPPPRPHSLPHSLPYSFRLLIHTDSSSPTAGMSPIVSPSGLPHAVPVEPGQYKSARIAMQVAHPADQPRTKYRAAKAGRWLCASDSFVPARRTDGSAEHQLASRSSAQAPDSQQDLRPLALDTT